MFAPGRRPFATVFHPNGYIYFSALLFDGTTPGIGRLNPVDGTVDTVKIDPTLAGTLAVDTNGDLIVASGETYATDDNYISRLNVDTHELTVISRGPGLMEPRAVWVDPSGRTFICEAGVGANTGGGVYEMDSNGVLSPFSINGQFANVVGVAGWPAFPNVNVARLNARVQELEAQVQSLQATLATADSTIHNLQSEATVVTASLRSISQYLAATFNAPQFAIPGVTNAQQVQSLGSAIQALNRGQQQALFLNLGGKK